MQPTDPHSDERQRRWRLLLGEPAGQLCKLGQDDLVIDRALAAVYDPEGLDGSKRRGGLGGSSPQVARWLGDIRQFFPSPVVRILQQDAVTRLQSEHSVWYKKIAKLSAYMPAPLPNGSKNVSATY